MLCLLRPMTIKTVLSPSSKRYCQSIKKTTIFQFSAIILHDTLTRKVKNRILCSYSWLESPSLSSNYVYKGSKSMLLFCASLWVRVLCEVIPTWEKISFSEHPSRLFKKAANWNLHGSMCYIKKWNQESAGFTEQVLA